MCPREGLVVNHEGDLALCQSTGFTGGSTTMTNETALLVERRLPRKPAIALLVASALALLAGCVEQPPPRAVRVPPPPQPSTDVYSYPTQGQTPEQQDRDRYECHEWAVKQTNFDPSAPNLPPHDQVRVVSGPPPGTGTAVGAVAGAILGAAVSSTWHSGTGALVGALAGGAVGTAADAANAQQVQEVRVRDGRQAAILEQKAANYRRAVSACLDARGYSVK